MPFWVWILIGTVVGGLIGAIGMLFYIASGMFRRM